MIPYSVYKLIHLTGILMLFLSLGGITMHSIIGGERNHSWRKPVGITNGLGLILTLIGGFGLLARIGVAHGAMPGWAYSKLGIWLIFVILAVVVVRIKTLAKSLWTIALFLGAIAAYLAGSKPF